MAEVSKGAAEIGKILHESRRWFIAIGIFSVFVNILMLTGPIYMLQVYSRVITARSEETLVALTLLITFLFVMMGILDYARAGVLSRFGARFQSSLDPQILKVTLDKAVSPAERQRPATGISDLEAIQRFTSSTIPLAFFDAPWTPLFLLVLFGFHWMLGLFSAFCCVLLFLIALFNQIGTAALQKESQMISAQSRHFVEQMRQGAETVQGLGMKGAIIRLAIQLRTMYLDKSLAASDKSRVYSVATKTLRLLLQSLMLGLGAWLAIAGEISAGLMIAGSILLGRVLAPIDQAVGNWSTLQQTLNARRNIQELLDEMPAASLKTVLPAPKAMLEVERLTLAPPGVTIPTVRNATFQIEPGHAIGIAGPSASGKSTLSRALAGVWPATLGNVRLDGADLEQYGDDIGKYIGYVPQEILLFDGTIAQNISRFANIFEVDDEAIVRAAQQTGAHDMILNLPGGYGFQVSAGGAALSGGQRQRIALARAFYGSPMLLILDEPDSNLDAIGNMAFAQAIKGHKERGGAAVIVAHRHSAFVQCDVVYIMQEGRPIPASTAQSTGRAPAQQLPPAKAKPESKPQDRLTSEERPKMQAPRIHISADGQRTTKPAWLFENLRSVGIEAAIARIHAVANVRRLDESTIKGKPDDDPTSSASAGS